METSWTRWRFWAIVVAVIAGAGWFFLHTPERSRPPGVLCGPEPAQGALIAAPQPRWRIGGWTLKPLATYSLRARLLSTRRYRYDYTSEISPVDFAIGWGRMSDSAVLDKLDISQRGRWYNFSYANEVVPLSEMSVCSANTHIIPVDDGVRDTVLRAIRGDIVNLEGFLVECLPPGGGTPWRSSLSRTDTGGGACEIMLVEKAGIE